MKFVDEFRDPDKARALAAEIAACAIGLPGDGRKIQIMEFCGGHTHTIFKYGIEQLLPENIEMVHGPGCPVCVLPVGRVDDCVALAEMPGMIFTSFGDALRVPGSAKSLLQAKAEGADVRMVYSPLDALEIARRNPQRQVVFFAIGFETTMPSTALTIIEAQREGIENFSMFCNHITSVPTLKAILEDKGLHLDGIVAPGHVAMVLGEEPFRFAAESYSTPIVISGFEPLDLMQSIWLVLKQLKERRCQLENQYQRIVQKRGNPAGLVAMRKVFELRESFDWRGLGNIENSGICIREAYASFDAEKKFAIPNEKVEDPPQCQCAEVLRGQIKPWQCKIFGSICTPQNPLGALMVSSEGACAAYYKFGNLPELLARKKARV